MNKIPPIQIEKNGNTVRLIYPAYGEEYRLEKRGEYYLVTQVETVALIGSKTDELNSHDRVIYFTEEALERCRITPNFANAKELRTVLINQCMRTGYKPYALGMESGWDNIVVQ